MEQPQILANDWRVRLITLSLAIVLLAGLSGLLYPSTYAPLIFLSVVGLAAVFCIYLWKPELALYTALLVVMLPGGFIPQGIHSLLNRLLTLLAFGIWCLDVVFRRRKVILTASSVLMIVFILWSTVTIFWADNMSSALTTIQMYVMRLLLFLILIPNEIKTKEKLDGLLRTLAFVGWILVITSAVTLLRDGYTPGTRFKLLDTNENAIGTLALVASLGVLWLAIHRPSKFPANSLPFFYIIFMIGLIGISGSRGSMLSLLIALLVFSYGRLTRRWARVILVIILMVLLIAPATFLTTFERFTENSTDSLAILGGRAALWKAAWQVIIDHMFTGVGIGSSSYAILPYLWMVSLSVGRDSVSMHNPVLTVWSETGIPGILLYLSVLVYAVRSFVTQYSRYKKLGIDQSFFSYFALVGSVFLGYMASWIKGGGAEADRIYFLLLALLLIPSHLDINSLITKVGSDHSVETNESKATAS